MYFFAVKYPFRVIDFILPLKRVVNSATRRLYGGQ